MALTPPKPRGNVKLEVVRQPQPELAAENPRAESAAPNPKLEANITAADEAEAAESREAAASSADDTKKGKAKPKRSTGATILKVVKEVANATDPRPSRKIPDAAEWEPYFKRGLVYLSVFYIWWLTTDDEGNEIGDTSKYELDDERAGLIGSPFARLFARTPLNRRYGRDLIENMDALVAVVAIVTYLMDTRPLWRAKRARNLRRQQKGDNVIPMRSAQNTTAQRPEPQPLQPQSQVTAPAQPAKTNGGTQPNAEPEPTFARPFKSEFRWTPGEQNLSD